MMTVRRSTNRKSYLYPVFWVAFIAVAALAFWKCRYGYAHMDEAFYLTLPYRFLQGDRMLCDEWNNSQLSAFLLMPVVRGYIWATGGRLLTLCCLMTDSTVSYFMSGIALFAAVLSYLDHREELDPLAEKIIYTGPIDGYFDYRLGPLQYRSIRFQTEYLEQANYQGNAVVNYTDAETPWTRIIEHKWFVFGKDRDGHDLPGTVISREYSAEWHPGEEPYYPINDARNNTLYRRYKALADRIPNVMFGGRLGEYKYYDMDATVLAALEAAKKLLA